MHAKKTPPPKHPYEPSTMALSMRFTRAQIARLDQLREKTGLAVTEIVRRAVDEYLDHKL